MLPSASVSLSDGQSVYAAPAWFGLRLPDEKDASFVPIRVPSSAPNGCGPVEVEDFPAVGGFVLLVERGGCLFEAKALAAQDAGASGLIVMNSLEGIYQVLVVFKRGCCLWGVGVSSFSKYVRYS